MKIIKNTKEITENRIHHASNDATDTATPDNASDLRQYYPENTTSILRNMLVLKGANHGYKVNVQADESMKFALSIESSIAMLYPYQIDEDTSKISKNIIRHGKGL